MFRLLIVDDEPEIVNWLFELFEECSAFELDLYKAYSGDDALDLLNRAKMDIVLTDIRMPGMTGLQLLERIKENWPKCKVIFLTGFNEFDYVYTAIKHDGVSYLLKTEEDDVIVSAVEKAVKEIQDELLDEELINRAKQQLSQAIPLLRKEYLEGLLQGLDPQLNLSQQRLDELEIALSVRAPLLLVVGRMERSGGEIADSLLTQRIYAVSLIFREYLAKTLKCEHIAISNSSLVWFVQPSSEADPYPVQSPDSPLKGSWDKYSSMVKGVLEAVQLACREKLGVSLSFIISGEPVLLDFAAAAYDRLRRLLNGRVTPGEDMVLTEGCFESAKAEEPAAYGEVRQISAQLKKVEVLGTFLERSQKEEFFQLLASLTNCLKGIKDRNFGPALQIFYAISVMFLDYINRWGLEESVSSEIRLTGLTRADIHESWSAAVEFFNCLGGVIFKLRRTEQENRTTDAVLRIKSYIGENLSGDLSLIRLADLVYFNPSYLSRLFKQATGINLSEYIYDMRIRKARELLGKSSLKIHEIAQSVGFESSHYFAHFFKKATGMTPQEYRDSVLNR